MPGVSHTEREGSATGGGRRLASPLRSDAGAADLVAAAADGSARALGRLISLVEDASPRLREVTALLAPMAGHAHVIGLTGAPGVGKSTSTSALVATYRARGQRVGVLAVDPSSPFTGGALLGDRIRMAEHATDPGVYIRSLASRGHLGGLSWATPQAVRVLDAVGFDVVLVETVGVGQAEVDVASLADCTLVLLAPGMGDGVQAAKAGILEIADVLVVNKADRPGADRTCRDLKNMIAFGHSKPAAEAVKGAAPAAASGSTATEGDTGVAAATAVAGGSWRPPVLKTVAGRGEGFSEVLAAIDAHRAWMAGNGELHRRRLARAREEIEQIALAGLRRRFAGLRTGSLLTTLAADVLSGRTDPYTAADDLLAATKVADD
jgi:LAO/AO transport system kinase